MLVGVIDVTNAVVETPQGVASLIRQAVEYVPAKRLIAYTNCPMAPMPRQIAAAQSMALGRGAALVYQSF